jgi:formylglycine-generating enzyme required for sulfatase activity
MASTETGTYTIAGGGYHSGTVTVPDAVTRATWTAPHWVLPSENEWYKAAYYQPASLGGDVDDYWLYPTRTNSEPYSDQPPGSGAPVQSNTANFKQDDGLTNGYNDGYAVTGSPTYVGTQNYLTNVGAYTQSAGFYGTFDQGGNVWELNEADINGDGSVCGKRGGTWLDIAVNIAASTQGSYPIAAEDYSVGFRVAIVGVPEPGSLAMLLGLALAALLSYWSKRT